MRRVVCVLGAVLVVVLERRKERTKIQCVI